MKKKLMASVLFSIVMVSISGCDNILGKVGEKVSKASTNTSAAPYQKDIHFTVLEKPLSFPKNHVMEYFWYGCPHCFAANDVIKSWAKNKNVELNIRHSVLYPEWFDDAVVFYTLKEMKADSAGDDYFSLRQRFLVSKSDSLSQALKNNNISQKEFDRVRSSDEVATAIQINKLVEGTLHTKGTPSFVVSGKYLINVGKLMSWSEVTTVADYLIKNQPK